MAETQQGQGERIVRVLSLGAGVQSSTLLLMAAAGELEHVPDYAVFADTQWEPQEVYLWLQYLSGVKFEQWSDSEGRLRFRATPGLYVGGRARIPTQVVTAGDIREATLKEAYGGGRRFASLPVYVASPSAGREGMMKRQCTKEFKLEPIRRWVRSQGWKRVEMWMGISMDEVVRMKPSRVKYIVNRWPLIEKGIDRRGCVRWLSERGHPPAPKSACIGCPYHADHQWRAMKDSDRHSWLDAVDFDRRVRRLPRINGDVFLHRSLKPLNEVDLSTAEERGQGSLFDAECEGMCGV